MSRYTVEQVESEADHLYLLVGMSPSYLMLRAYAATLKAAQGGVTEAMVERVAKAIADAAGHGMREKCESQARAAIAALSAEPAAQGERMPVPFYVGRNHPNQAYVTLGFDSEDACDRFYKAITRGKGLYTAPPAQPAEVEATLRRILERGKHRTDGDLVTLLDRVEHMTRGDQDLIAMQRTENRLLDEKSAQPVERVPEGAWTDDAKNWGVALNDAAWTFINSCPEKSALLFNTCKTALRAAILTYAEKVAATPAAPADGDGKEGWIDVATLPSVKDGHEAHFWIAVRRAHGDKVYVFPAIYANALPLSCGDYDPEDLEGPFWRQRLLPEDSDGDIAITGWYDIRSNSEYDSYYTPVCNRGDVILAWHKGPEFPTTGAAR